MQGMAEADAQALERLLSPHGLLFKAMLGADAEGLINFIFPLERLPTRTQLLLRSGPGRSVSCLSKFGQSMPILDLVRTDANFLVCFWAYGLLLGNHIRLLWAGT